MNTCVNMNFGMVGERVFEGEKAPAVYIFACLRVLACVEVPIL